MTDASRECLSFIRFECNDHQCAAVEAVPKLRQRLCVSFQRSLQSCIVIGLLGLACWMAAFELYTPCRAAKTKTATTQTPRYYPSLPATLYPPITMSAPAASSKPVLLPQTGTARVKNVMSGDTVILWGKASAPHLPPPQVQFTLDGLMSPR